MKINLYKKISFGISLEIKLEEYKKIINQFGDFISSVYFSLPLGAAFHTRVRVIKEYEDKEARKKLFEILKLFKNNNIKLEIVINQYGLTSSQLIEAIEFINKNIDFDSICTLDEYLPILYAKYPDAYFISSFNNLKLSSKDIKNTSHRYKQIVVGNNFMRDIELLEKIKMEKFDTKLLLNNGCSFNCGSCRNGAEQCANIFEDNIKKIGVQNFYAIQSFFPSELHRLLEKIELNELKISNRPCNFEYLSNCLDSYINNNESYIDKNVNNYHLWWRLGHFGAYYGQFDFKKIKKMKERLWNNKFEDFK